MGIGGALYHAHRARRKNAVPSRRRSEHYRAAAHHFGESAHRLRGLPRVLGHSVANIYMTIPTITRRQALLAGAAGVLSAAGNARSRLSLEGYIWQNYASR